MTNRADILEALAERVEQAGAEEQAELIGDAWDALGPITLPTSEEAARFAGMMDAEAYESAAVMLVPPGIGWTIGFGVVPGAGDAPQLFAAMQLGPDMRLSYGQATPALALTAACLRAHASIERTKNNG